MKKALLIGINYINKDKEVQLSGCIDDVLNMKRMLITKMGYLEQRYYCIKR